MSQRLKWGLRFFDSGCPRSSDKRLPRLLNLLVLPWNYVRHYIDDMEIMLVCCVFNFLGQNVKKKNAAKNTNSQIQCVWKQLCRYIKSFLSTLIKIIVAYSQIKLAIKSKTVLDFYTNLNLHVVYSQQSTIDSGYL